MRLWTTRIALICGVFLAGVSSLAGFAQADELLKGNRLVTALQQGGHVIYLRHAETDRSTLDKNRHDFSQWAQQRNLSEQGRQQARLIGRAVKALNIPVSEVVSSPYCRCLETANWAFGQTTVDEELAFAIAMTKTEAKRLGAALRKKLGKKPADGQNTVVVAHTANLKEAAGLWPKPEGVAMIFRPSSDGAFALVGRIESHEWVSLAEANGVSIDISQERVYLDMRPTWCGSMQVDAMQQP